MHLSTTVLWWTRSSSADCQMTTALRLFKKVSHTMLRMAKNLNDLQYIMNINNGRQKYSFFYHVYFSSEANNKINRPINRSRGSWTSNSRIFIGVLSKFPKLKTSVFRIAGQRLIRWIRVVSSLSNLCLNCNHCISIISHIFWTPANKVPVYKLRSWNLLISVFTSYGKKNSSFAKWNESPDASEAKDCSES